MAQIKQDVVRRLKSGFASAGFVEREVGASGAFHYFFVKDLTLNDSGASCTAVVRALPSNVQPNEFHFETTLIMDGSVLSEQLQPPKFMGTVSEFIDRKVSLFNALFNMEDFYVRTTPYDEHAARESMKDE